MALTSQQQADGIQALDDMPAALKFDEEYIQLVPQPVAISGPLTDGTVQRDIGGEGEDSFRRDRVIVVKDSGAEVWEYYRYFGPNTDDNAEVWRDITEDYVAWVNPITLTPAQQNRAMRQLRFMIGKKGNRGRRRRQQDKIDITINGATEAWIRQDEYDGPLGSGIIVLIHVVVSGETWEFRLHKGPETHRDRTANRWMQIIPD